LAHPRDIFLKILIKLYTVTRSQSSLNRHKDTYPCGDVDNYILVVHAFSMNKIRNHVLIMLQEPTYVAIAARVICLHLYKSL